MDNLLELLDDNVDWTSLEPCQLLEMVDNSTFKIAMISNGKPDHDQAYFLKSSNAISFEKNAIALIKVHQKNEEKHTLNAYVGVVIYGLKASSN